MEGPGGALAFSPDGKTLATGSYLRKNNAVKLWEAATGQLLQTFPATQNRPIVCVTFSPDGKTLASADDRAILLRELASGRERRTLTGHTGRVSETAFSPDGETLASAGWDYTVRLWSPTSGSPIRTLRGHEDRVNAVAFSPDGKTLASGGNDNVARLWEAQEAERAAIATAPEVCSNIRFAPNSELMALTMSDGSIRLWDTARWQQIRRLRRRGNPLYAIGFTPDSKELVVNAGGSTVLIWNLTTDQARLALRLPSAKEFFHAFAPNGKTLAVCDMENKTISLWDLETKSTLHPPLTYPERPLAAVFSPDGKTLAIALDDPQNRILLLDTTRWQEANTLTALNGDPNTGHTNAITQLTFSPDGKILASGSSDASVVLWEVATGRCLHKIEAHRGTVSGLAFSPDGKTLATGGVQDHLVKLWDVDRPRALAVFTDHSYGITSLHFSVDGRLLVTKDRKTVRFWHAPSLADIQQREQAERLQESPLARTITGK
jgi:WD40 repeat protein